MTSKTGSRSNTARRGPNWPSHFARHRESESKSAVPLWSPAVYKNGATRGNAGVECWGVAALDIDDGTDVATLEYWLGDLEYVIVSTHSHTPEHPKLRIVLPLDEQVPADEYDSFWRRANQHIFRGHIDPSTKDAARMLYVPSCKPGAERVAIYHSGKVLGWRKLPGLPKPKALPKRSKSEGNTTDDHRRARALFAKWESELAEVPKGSRHNRLMEIGRAGGGLVESQLLDYQETRDRLLAASATNGSLAEDGQRAVLQTIDDALEFGRRDPWAPDDLPDSPAWLARQRFARRRDGGMVDARTGEALVRITESPSINGHARTNGTANGKVDHTPPTPPTVPGSGRDGSHLAAPRSEPDVHN